MELLRIDCRGFVLPVCVSVTAVTGRLSAMAWSTLGLIILPVLTLNTTRISIQFIDELQTLRQVVTGRIIRTAQQNWQTCHRGEITLLSDYPGWLVDDVNVQDVLEAEHVSIPRLASDTAGHSGYQLVRDWLQRPDSGSGSGVWGLWCRQEAGAYKDTGPLDRRPEPVEQEVWAEDVSSDGSPSTWVTPSPPSPTPPPSECRSVSLYYSLCVLIMTVHPDPPFTGREKPCNE